MSASDKKKLRKELNAAATTEKQQAEMKQQKKTKVYTLTFAIVMVLVVALVACATLQAPLTRLSAKNTVAATVDGHKLNATEFNYYYCDAISSFYNQFSDYSTYQDLYVQIYTGLTPSKALDEQTYSEEVGTWADYFIDAALANATWTYAMYDKAVADNYTLSEDEQTSLSSTETYLQFYAYYYGYSDVDSYLRAMYGSTANLKSYLAYYEISALATSYASAYYDSLEYTDDDFRTYEADKMKEFNSYSWAYYYVDADDYLIGGTTVTGEDGKETVEYSDAEIAAAVEAAKAAADSVIELAPTTVTELNDALNSIVLGTNASDAADGETTDEEEESESVAATEKTAILYSSLTSYATEDVIEWLTSEDRNDGDLTVIADVTTDEDGNVTATNGYYIVFHVKTIDNTMSIGSVRHLLVAFEEDDDGNVTEDAKAAALAEAEDLLEEYMSGEKTEEAFTELLKKHSDDVDSSNNVNNDGLYQNITPDSGYVTEFADWATADHEVGDVEIIETTYGYHIMYYVEAAELNYRDTLINNELCSNAYTEWEEDILDDVTSEIGNTKFVDRDFIISG